MNTIQTTLGGILLSAMAMNAQAASLSLEYTGPNQIIDGTILVAPSDTVTFDVVMDFSGTPTLGGGFDIVFDSSQLEFGNFINFEIGEDGFGRDPDEFDGLLESWAFGAFAGLSGPETVGSVSFTFIGKGITDVFLTATSGIGGPFVSFDNPSMMLDVDFGSARIGMVPVPAAVWFLLSGLGALFGVSRRKNA